MNKTPARPVTGHYVVQKQKTALGATVHHIISGPHATRKAAHDKRRRGTSVARFEAE